MNARNPHEDDFDGDAQAPDHGLHTFERVRNRGLEAPGLSDQRAATDEDNEDLDLWNNDDFGEGRLFKNLLLIGLGLLLVAVVGGGVLIALNFAEPVSDPHTLPLVQAPPEPEKQRPEDPGGMQIDHQDDLVLNQLPLQEGANTGEVERLLPPPELPLDIPLSEGQPPETTKTNEETLATATGQTGGRSLYLPKNEIESLLKAPIVTAGGDKKAKVDTAATAQALQRKEKPEGVLKETPEKASKSEENQQKKKPLLRGKATRKVAQPSSGQYVVQLAAFVNENKALEGWARLKKALPGLLGDQGMIIEKADISGIGTRYRLQTGPFPSRSAGLELCQKVKAAGRDCLVKKVK